MLGIIDSLGSRTGVELGTEGRGVDTIPKEVVFLFPEAIAVEFAARDLVEVYERHSLDGCHVGSPLRLWLAYDEAPLVAGITRRKRHEDGVGACLSDLSDIAAQVVAVAVDGVGNLLAKVEARDKGILSHAVDHTTGALGIEEVGMVVMTDAHDDPVARLEGLAHGRPEVGIEVAGGHAAEGLVLNRDLTPVEILAGEIAPAPLTIVAITQRAVAHGGVADEEEHRVRALTGRARDRTAHKGLGDGVGGIVDDLLFATRCGQVVELLCSQLHGGCKECYQND